MNQLNSLIIEGNVVRAPELREPKDGFKVCTIPLAVNRFYRNAKGDGVNEVSFFDVETFGKMAEVCYKKCGKGRGLSVVGRLRQARWVKSDGHNTSKISIIAEHIEFKKKVVKQESSEDMQGIADATRAAAEQDVNIENIVYDGEPAVF